MDHGKQHLFKLIILYIQEKTLHLFIYCFQLFPWALYDNNIVCTLATSIFALCCHVFFVVLQASAWYEILLEWLLRLSIMTQDFSCLSMSSPNSTRKETCTPSHLRYIPMSDLISYKYDLWGSELFSKMIQNIKWGKISSYH